MTLPYDISQTGHDCAIQVSGSASNRTIYWLFDGAVYRWLYYGSFGDVISTVDSKQFQANIVLWGSADDAWGDMGQLSWNSSPFPIYAHFSNVQLTTGIHPDPQVYADGVDRPGTYTCTHNINLLQHMQSKSIQIMNILPNIRICCTDRIWIK